MANTIIIDDAQLRLICPRLSSARRAELLPVLNAAMSRYEIDRSPARVAAFLSNLMHESADFKYSKEIWGPTPAQRRYEGRRDLGNTQPGDGKRFMGRGFIQTTGRANYARVGRALGLDLIARPEQLEQTAVAMLSAAFFWSDNRLSRLADCLTGRRDANEQKVLTAICRRINGGINGLDERVRNYWRCLAVLHQTPAASEANLKLALKIADNPAIPTPETHTADELAEAQENPAAAQEEIARAEVREQEKAAGLIDLAEQTPASVMKTTATSIWSRTGGRVAQGFAWLVAGLQAGNWGAWLVALVAVAFIVWLVWSNRTTLKRWKALLFSKGKELAGGA